MKSLQVIVASLIVLFIFGCSSILEKAREHDKFSLQKKYAILPFDCANKQLGIDLSEAVKERLLMYGYDLIEQSELDKLLAESNLTKEEVVKNYAQAIGRLKGIDGIIIGYIGLDKKNAESGKEASSSLGGAANFINVCDALVVELNSGDILSRGRYSAPSNSVFTGSMPMEEVGKRIALLLSPH